jgi:hypothetical protein
MRKRGLPLQRWIGSWAILVWISQGKRPHRFEIHRQKFEEGAKVNRINHCQTVNWHTLASSECVPIYGLAMVKV